ncbi:1,3-beta-glucanosyltransferase gas1, partial [Dinochytrium kinnereticum]
YEWCGNSNYELSGYADRTREMESIQLPLLVSEYGCNAVRPRRFSEIDAMYGSEMLKVWSGGIMYEFTDEDNDYGIVQYSNNGSTVVPIQPEFDAFKKRMQTAESRLKNMTDIIQTQFTKYDCPATFEGNWLGSTDLPTLNMPNDAVCISLAGSLECVANSNVEEKEVGSLLSTACGLLDGILGDSKGCAPISPRTSNQSAGEFSHCYAKDRLSWAYDKYYRLTCKASKSCDFDGTATLQPRISSSQPSSTDPTCTVTNSLGTSNGGPGTALHSTNEDEEGRSPVERMDEIGASSMHSIDGLDRHRNSVRFQDSPTEPKIVVIRHQYVKQDAAVESSSRSVPSSFKLEKVLSPHLLAELQDVRSRELGAAKTSTLQYLSSISPKAFKIPPESEGIALGILREVLPSCKGVRPRPHLRMKADRMASEKPPIKSVEKGENTKGARKRSLAHVENHGLNPEHISTTPTPLTPQMLATAVPLPGRRASLIEPSFMATAKRQSVDGVIEEEDFDEPDPEEGQQRHPNTPAPNTPSHRISAPDGYLQWKRQLKRRAGSISVGSGPSRNVLTRERPYSLDDFIILKKLANGRYSALSQKKVAWNPQIIEAVKREKLACSHIFSRFCQQFLATFQSASSLFIIFEWAPSSVQQLMSLHRSFTEQQARFYIAELTCALEFLHSRNIIHRQIEPTSILVDGEGHIKLSEFGNCAIIEEPHVDVSYPCIQAGRYQAPEILLGESHGPSSDWFSVGIVLYEMLTGTIAFGGGNILDTVASILGGQRRREKDDSMDNGDSDIATTYRTSRAMLKDELNGRPMLSLPLQYRNLADMYNLSRPAEDIVRRLMEVYPQHRMTALRGCMDVKAHPWLRHIAIAWKEVDDGKLQPPFVPGNEEDENLLSSLGNTGVERIEHTSNRMSIEAIGTDNSDSNVSFGSDDSVANAFMDW